MSGGELDTADRNIERARYLRRYLSKGNGLAPGGKELSGGVPWLGCRAYCREPEA